MARESDPLKGAVMDGVDAIMKPGPGPSSQDNFRLIARWRDHAGNIITPEIPEGWVLVSARECA